MQTFLLAAYHRLSFRKLGVIFAKRDVALTEVGVSSLHLADGADAIKNQTKPSSPTASMGTNETSVSLLTMLTSFLEGFTSANEADTLNLPVLGNVSEPTTTARLVTFCVDECCCSTLITPRIIVMIRPVTCFSSASISANGRGGSNT